ncbi:biotin-dependent carboxyltransferase family protein [Halobacillus naozhouensis]|uniref:Biotin-dependent carboxyltransferase family protein n=1 Tax=Halobacillus naozhouensis TaxID=554880 RepID=A0ABY8IUY6_9BACI|nr:biotin-dependent carboxyltransferase family protein [Halobacillus naozhouensis]WFT73949.1 biotin-dependent carboxyltransferase family protein [Halobacillus naozhouensis]
MLKIIKEGMLTSVQDLGRTSYQKYGVIVSGSMDSYAHRIANLLVGNEENAATLEATLLGPEIEFKQDSMIAICGGDLSPAINGQKVNTWRSIFVKEGSVLKFGKSRTGCRAYIAVAGGLDVPEVMDSQSTYLRAELGGYQGRALKSGDQLPMCEPNDNQKKIMEAMRQQMDGDHFYETDWMPAADMTPPYSSQPVIQMLKGPQYALFNEQSQRNIFEESYSVSSQSDRMGYRLEGSPLSLTEPKELISEAVAFGSIQVPSDGNPIILMADRQTTGGYPKIGQIASVDLSLVSQLKPGDKMSFKEITLEEAQKALIKQEQSIQILKRSIILKSKEEL